MTFNSKTTTVFWCGAYIAALQWAYYVSLTRLYQYEGYRHNSDPLLLAITTLMALLPAFVMPADLKRPSQVAYWLLYLFVIVPVGIVPVYTLSLPLFSILLFCGSVIGAFILLGLIYRAPLWRTHFTAEPYQFRILIWILSAALYALIIYVFGLHIKIVSLTDVYSVRSQYMDAVDRAGSLVAYAISWLGYIINPLLIAQGLVERRTGLVALGVLGQALVYSITGFKSVFFSAALVLLILFFLRRQGKGFGARVAISGTVLIACSTGLYLVFDFIWGTALFVNRSIAMTGLLSGLYYDFFSHHPQVHLAHSILRPFLNYPYSYEPPMLIGYTYLRTSSVPSANANLWADAYANFGFLGIFAFTALLALVLWLYDSAAVELDNRIPALVMSMPAITLANSALLTCLLSHGMGLALVLMFLHPRSQRSPVLNTVHERYPWLAKLAPGHGNVRV